MQTGTRSPAQVADTYFRCWVDGDFDTLRGVLADDATFRGPLGAADDGDSCLAGLRGMRAILRDVVVVRRWVDGPDVLTWFELHTTVAPPAPTANWMHVEDGRITSIRVTFDPRDLVAARPT
jgi:ketosteroid isomerase-like protein